MAQAEISFSVGRWSFVYFSLETIVLAGLFNVNMALNTAAEIFS